MPPLIDEDNVIDFRGTGTSPKTALITEEGLVGRSGPSFLDQTAGAFAVGMQNDPLFGFALNQIADLTGMWERGDIERFGQEMVGSNLADVFKVVGEWGPMIAAGAGMYSAGKLGATAGLRGLAAARGATGTGQMGRVAARAADFAGNIGVGQGSVARLGKPAIERGAEMVGGAAGIGTHTGATEAARGGDWGDIFKSFGVGAGITGAFEGSLYGVGKLVRATHETSLPKVLEHIRKGRKERRDIGKELKYEVVKWKNAFEKANKTETQHAEMVNINRGLIGATSLEAKRLQRLGAAPEDISLVTERGREAAKAIEEVRRPAQEALMKLRMAKTARQQHKVKVRQLLDPNDYTRDTPFNPTGKRAAVSGLLAKALKTPEGLGKELGTSTVKLVKGARDAESEIAFARSVTMTVMAKMRGQLGAVLGRKTWAGVQKDPRYKQIFDVWEKGGDEAVGAYLTDMKLSHAVPVAKEMFENVRGLRDVYKNLVKLGAEPVLDDVAMTRLGVREFIPHVLDYSNEDDFRKQMVKVFMRGGKTKADATVEAERYLAHAVKHGLQKFGSIDHQRRYSGTLADKIAQGHQLVDDPIEAISMYMDQVGRRLAYGSRFGFNAELKGALQRQAIAEGANAGLVNTVGDTLLGFKYYPAAERRMWRNITDMETATKLTLAVIPNMSQSINTVLAHGFRNTVKGMGKYFLPNLTRGEFARATGTAQSIYDVSRHMFYESALRGTRPDRFFERLARGTLRYTGFESVENFNRFVGGVAGYYTVQRDLAQAIGGRLRGNSLDVARRRMRSLGINLDEKVVLARREAARLGKRPEEVPISGLFRPEETTANGTIVRMGELDMAMFNAAKQTQFVPDATRLPAWWQTPVGRVIFQFKRFALSQGRFLRDQVFAEATRGNMKPLAYFVSIYPAAGEVVANTRFALRGKERDQDHVYRLMTNLGYVGGFGLAWDTIASAKWGRLGEGVAGPFFGDFINIAETIAQDQNIGRFFTRQPAAQAAKAIVMLSAGSAQMVQELIDKEMEKRPEYDEAIDINELIKRE